MQEKPKPLVPVRQVPQAVAYVSFVSADASAVGATAAAELAESAPPGRRVARVVGYVSFASAGASIVGATATAESAGPVHMAFAIGVLGSLVTTATAFVMSGRNVLRGCGQTAQAFGDAPSAEAGQPVEPVSPQARWVL